MLGKTVQLEKFFLSIGLESFYVGTAPGDWKWIAKGKLEETIRRYRSTRSTPWLPLRCCLTNQKPMAPAWATAADGTLFIFREAKAEGVFSILMVHATIIPQNAPEQFQEGWFMVWELRDQWNSHHKQ